jgi:hypothetical protein
LGEERDIYKVLVGNPEGSRSLGKPRIVLKYILKT